MTASDRLKELAPAGGWPDPDFSSTQGEEVWVALVSVIEAAERIAGGATHWDEANGQMDACRHSVAALNTALEGGAP